MRNPTILALALAAFSSATAYAHCDTLDGPVVTAARAALQSGDVNLVLPWVQPDDEPAIRQAFARTMKVRGMNPEAKDLAETWFFETLVRIHRRGEGASYDGLKPAGTEPDEAVAAADSAIKARSDDALTNLLTKAAIQGLHHRFERVLAARNYKSSDVQAGRDYVKAYVDFIHYAERLQQSIHAAGAEHNH